MGTWYILSQNWSEIWIDGFTKAKANSELHQCNHEVKICLIQTHENVAASESVDDETLNVFPTFI